MRSIDLLKENGREQAEYEGITYEVVQDDNLTFTARAMEGDTLLWEQNGLRSRGTAVRAMKAAWENGAIRAGESNAETNRLAEVAGFTSAINTESNGHSEAENKTIREYVRAVNEKLKEFAQKYISDANTKFARFTIGRLSERQVSQLNGVTGTDYSGYSNAISSDTITHINNRHGENGRHDQTMRDVNDIARIGYVLDNADVCDYLRDENGKIIYSSTYTDASNSPSPLLVFAKKVDSTYYVVEAVGENAYKKLWVQSAYMSNKAPEGSVTQVLHAESSARSSESSETPLPSLKPSTDTIARSGENVKLPGDVEAALRAGLENSGYIRVNDIRIAVQKNREGEWLYHVQNGEEGHFGEPCNTREDAVESAINTLKGEENYGRDYDAGDRRGDRADEVQGALDRGAAEPGGRREGLHRERAAERAEGARDGREVSAGRGVVFEHEYDGSEDNECRVMTDFLKTVGVRGVVYYTGQATMNGMEQDISGMVDKNGNVYIRADDPDFTVWELGNHERMHYLCRSNREFRSQAMEAVRQSYTEEELNHIVDEYREVYETVYGQYSNGQLINAEQVEERILEEIAADALAGMDQGFREGSRQAAAQVQQQRIESGEVSRDFGLPGNHIERRTSFGNRGQKAFGWDYPQLYPFLRAAASEVSDDLSNTTRGERMVYAVDGVGNTAMDGINAIGTRRHTSEAVAYLRDSFGMSYAQIEEAVADYLNGGEAINRTDCKKLEYVLDELLSREHPAFGSSSETIPANDAYIAAKETIPGAELRTGAEYDGEDDIEELPFALGGRDMESRPFEESFEAWANEGRPGERRLFAGKTSTALQSIGVEERPIYWDTSKINKIQRDHPEMSDSVIAQVPHIFESPILIMESATQSNRVTMLGEVYAENGIPVLAVLELAPTNRRNYELKALKVASVYTKTNPNTGLSLEGTQNLINKSNILYVNPDTKRTADWLSLNRLQLPFGITSYGSLGSVSLVHRDVNGNFSAESGTTTEPAWKQALRGIDLEDDSSYAIGGADRAARMAIDQMERSVTLAMNLKTVEEWG